MKTKMIILSIAMMNNRVTIYKNFNDVQYWLLRELTTADVRSCLNIHSIEY